MRASSKTSSARIGGDSASSLLRAAVSCWGGLFAGQDRTLARRGGGGRSRHVRLLPDDVPCPDPYKRPRYAGRQTRRETGRRLSPVHTPAQIQGARSRDLLLATLRALRGIYGTTSWRCGGWRRSVPHRPRLLRRQDRTKRIHRASSRELSLRSFYRRAARPR
jgi:hypothetical protein